jgi:hypothetical protein
MINKMSSCNCGLNNSGIPKPSEGKRYAPLSGAYDTLNVSMNKNRKVSTMEYFLMIIIIIILFTLVKDYKWY